MSTTGEIDVTRGVERRAPASGPARADRIALFILLVSVFAAAGAVAFVVFVR
jgi:hypothetical protein